MEKERDNDYIRKKQGERVRECMKEVHVTGQELAKKLNYSPQQISYILNGKRRLTTEMAINITDYLNKKKFLALKEAQKILNSAKSTNPLAEAMGVPEKWFIQNELVEPLDYKYLLCESDHKCSWMDFDPPKEQNIDYMFASAITLLLHRLGFDLNQKSDTHPHLFRDIYNPKSALHRLIQDSEKSPNFTSQLVRIQDGKSIELSMNDLLQLFKDYVAAIQTITNRTFEKAEWQQALNSPPDWPALRNEEPLWPMPEGSAYESVYQNER